ncbi:unnamed protein product [Darwinula stevensoni]|uniref:Uncharacterized protein n=1 Tax=Darwinula stevensoni TaxID=69355 RepID=A0A7R9ACK3_9CRUS|nr:unnamed protein product [Darwinula stevensoni]CAG0899930.1 unnamed protein product [Darwinula stevensoni]
MDWSAILISLIVDSSLNLLMAIILLYGAYYVRLRLLNKKVYYVPWMLKTGFLMLCMVAFGIYNIYLVVAKTENSQEASFWGSLCALFWLIICEYAFFF